MSTGEIKSRIDFFKFNESDLYHALHHFKNKIGYTFEKLVGALTCPHVLSLRKALDVCSCGGCERSGSLFQGKGASARKEK